MSWFKKAKEKYNAYKAGENKRAAMRLQKLRKKRLEEEGKAKLRKLEEKERSRIRKARETTIAYKKVSSANMDDIFGKPKKPRKDDMKDIFGF